MGDLVFGITIGAMGGILATLIFLGLGGALYDVMTGDDTDDT